MVFGLDAVKPLKAFQLTLTSSEEKKLKEIIAYGMTHHKAYVGGKAITNGEAPGGVLVAASSGSSSSSSSIIPMKPVARNADKVGKAVLKQDVKSKSMLRFFPMKPSDD